MGGSCKPHGTLRSGLQPDADIVVDLLVLLIWVAPRNRSKIQRVVTLQLIEKDVAVEIGPQSFGIARDNYEDANELHVSLLSLVTHLTPSAPHYAAFRPRDTVIHLLPVAIQRAYRVSAILLCR
ncbi:hypothetical protein Nepgr_026712 [Nepenthes gracilis]|uniref:Uncharacterized protein n=1 Tax=Nepenthes gracilis TaxID=150966 RepID=A0AAD3Y2C7_NEPGR|nr:hypothetical protein Nepgr_026712 [Nepenthes gracilis]